MRAGNTWGYSVNGIIPEDQSLPPGVVRYGAAVEYNGRLFCGWQRQSHSPSVQAVVEAALSTIANEPVTVSCAGRTDTGVHATNQIIHFDSAAKREPRNWLLGSNTQLPDGVGLRWLAPVSAHFHARFSATSRTYRYIIANEPVRSALFAGMVTWEKQPLDDVAMNKAAQALVGEHDFSSFRAAGCQSRTPYRCITRIDVTRQGSLVIIEVTANAFLHHMVRNIAGVLLGVGRGDKDVSWVQALLTARDRTKGEITAPPHGLYLVAVGYPEKFCIPALPPGPYLVQAG